MKMFLSGGWVDKADKIEVRNPYDGSIVDSVPRGDSADVDEALRSAVQGAKVMARLQGYDRYRILHKAADLIESRSEEFAQIITREQGKIIGEARAEVRRTAEVMTLSSEEAKRIHGETIPVDGASNGAGKIAFTLRIPCGIVAAITPFNFPLNLVAHKVGPALAAGNAVVLKPATDTPLSALKLIEVLLEAGIPEEALSCITGRGGEIGDALCGDPRVRKITFTGSRDVGERISRLAGIKKVTMELGSNAPFIIMPDADLEKAAVVAAATGYANAGQVCMSTQRVIVQRKIYDDFLQSFKPRVEELTTGDPLAETTRVGTMINEHEAMRVERWVDEAVKEGARLISGGRRRGAIYEPTLVADAKPGMKISCNEVFGPLVAVTKFDDIDEAIAIANDSIYGLSAGIFTENLEWAMKFIQEVHAGNLIINWGPLWRSLQMPYGGFKESGFGKEGPRYAVEEMTELKLVCFHRMT